MKIDLYTKGALTVIAAALVALVVQNGVAPATAQSGITKVAVCSPKNPDYCVGLMGTAGGFALMVQPWDR